MSKQQREGKQDTWTALAGLAGMIPGVQMVAQGVARNTVQRLLGFWVLWHLYGGIKAGVAAGAMAESSAYRQKAEFLEVFGMEVEEFAPEIAAIISKMGLT